MKQKGKRFYIKENTKTNRFKPKAESDELLTSDAELLENKKPSYYDSFKNSDVEVDFQKKTEKISKKKSQRKILSFEDLPLDNSESVRFQNAVKNTKLNKKRIVFSVVIVLVLALCVFIYANRDRFTFSNIRNWVEYGVFNMDSEEQFPVSTHGDIVNNGNFSRIQSNLLYVSDTRFVTLNSYGREIYSAQQTFSRPVLAQAADSDLSLVYNLGGADFTINTLESTSYVGKAEDNITVADISKSGVYALVTEKDGYLSKLFVYSPEHKQIYAYSFADYYITSVSLDSKGTKAVLSGVSTHNGNEISSIYLLDFTEEEPLVFEEFEDNMIYFVDHISDSYVCVIGEKASYSLNVRTGSFNKTEYDGKTLTTFYINTDTNTFSLSLSRSGDGRMCDILNFSTNGSLRSTISTDLMITSISTYKNRVSALSSDMLYLYTKEGTLIKKEDAGLDPHSAILYSTNSAYVLGVSEIRRLSF